MLVTPGTSRPKGATGQPARAMKGSIQPPTQASTWQSKPWRAAIAATSAIGSTTPWA